jgi:hypothetical protein
VAKLRKRRNFVMKPRTGITGKTSRVVVPAVVALAGVALAFGARSAIAQLGNGDNGRPSKLAEFERANPVPTYVNDEQRTAAERSAGQDQAAADSVVAFRRAFGATGQDIHTLPVAAFETTDRGVTDLENAVVYSAAIVRGVVVEQQLLDAHVVSRLRVQGPLAGPASEREVVVVQVGGPRPNDGTPILTEMSSDPILWKGRTYLLFLRECSAPVEGVEEPHFCIDGSGRQFEVTEGRLRAPGRAIGLAEALNGRDLAAAEAEIGDVVSRSGAGGPP